MTVGCFTRISMRSYGGCNSLLAKGLQNIYNHGWVFKSGLLLTMCLNLAIYNVLTAYSRQSTAAPFYFPTTVVFLAEILKLTVSLIVIWWENRFDCYSVYAVLKREIVYKPKEFLKLLIPATIYALQNNLVYLVLTNMEPTMYQVLTHLKIFTTALFMRILLGYNLTTIRWIALFTLFCGVAVVEMGPAQVSTQNQRQNYWLGVTGVGIISICSGFAGVYFEKQLKQNSVPFWIRNIEMYVWGIAASGLGLLAQEGSKIAQKGFFFGYSPLVWVIIFLEGAGGLYVSLVMRHLDNMFRTFASSVGIILTALGSAIVFRTNMSFSFAVGCTLVCCSVFLYSLPLGKAIKKDSGVHSQLNMLYVNRASQV